MPWLITLIFLIRPSIIQSQGMTRPQQTQLKTKCLAQKLFKAVAPVSILVSTVRTRNHLPTIQRWPSAEWIMMHSSISVASAHLRGADGRGHRLGGGWERTVCRTSKSNYNIQILKSPAWHFKWQPTMKLYGSLAFDLCAAADKVAELAWRD